MNRGKFLATALLGSLALSGVASAETQKFSYEYDVYGNLYGFGKMGFNNAGINKAAGKYPTDRWASVAVDLYAKGSLEGLLYGIGGMIATPFWDPNRISYPYINGTNKPNFSKSTFNGSNDAIDYHYYVLSMAYLGYKYNNEYLGAQAKIGRFDDHGLDWFGGFAEGAELRIGNDLAKLQVNFITRRGLAYNEWLYDFYWTDGAAGSKSWHIATSIEFSLAGINFKPQFWYRKNDWAAPGLSGSYSFGDELKSTTTLHSLFVSSHKTGVNTYKNGTSKRLATVLIVKEDLSYAGWNFGGGIWKNFGNVRPAVGSYGNKSGLDLFTSSAFGFNEWAQNDINGYNAITGWLYAGRSYGTFSWNLLARATAARESYEQSIALNLGYKATENLNLGFKIEWFNDVTRPYKHGIDGIGRVQNDRSHAFVMLDYKL